MSKAFEKIKAGLEDAIAYAEGDTSRCREGRRIATRKKKKKRYIIECRYLPLHENSKLEQLGFCDWFRYNSYETRDRRDQAYTALVKKAINRQVFRKRDIT